MVVLGGSKANSKKVELIDLKTNNWETLPDMNDLRPYIGKGFCFIDNHAYVAGGHKKRRLAEKFDYKAKTWIPLPNYPIKENLDEWSGALAFIPQEIKEETKVLLQVTEP